MDLNKFNELPILGILRGVQKQQIDPLFNILIESGLTAVEITLNTPNALELISFAHKTFKNGITIGAGTVLSLKEARSAIKAGATFIVAPNFDKEISKYCSTNKIPYFPGALTPSEIYTAWESGAEMIKVFPASLFGPGYFKEIKGPFSDIKLMAVGGVTPANIIDYFRKGAGAAAIGGSVFRKEAMLANDWLSIRKNVTQYVEAYNKFRPEN